MREVSLSDLPEVDFSTLPDAPEIGLSELPEVDLSSLSEGSPLEDYFGPVATAAPQPSPGPVVDRSAELAAIARGAMTEGLDRPRRPAGADALATAIPRPAEAIDHTAELQAAFQNARTDGLERPPRPPDAAGIAQLPESQRVGATRPGPDEPYMPERQGPLYDPTVLETVAEQGKGFVRGATAAGAYGTEAGGTVGDIAGALTTNLLPWLAGPVAGAAVNTYYAYLRDLNEQADQYGRTNIADMDQKRAMARAAVALAFTKIPGFVGSSPLTKGATGAGIGGAGNIMDVAATQLAEEGRIDVADPAWAEQYKMAGLLGVAIGGGVGSVTPTHGQTGKRPAFPREAEAPRVPEAVAPIPEVPLSALPEEAPPVQGAQEFDDAAVDAAYTAQYEPAPDAPGIPPAAPAEIPLSALPETEAAPAAPAPKLPETNQVAVNEALSPEYQRLAIRIARQNPELSEEQAMSQAFVLQRGDTEAKQRGAGAAVENRRIEFEAPLEKTDAMEEGLSLNEYLYAQKPKIFLSDDVRNQLGFWDGQAGYKTPRSLKAIREEFGDLFTLDPKKGGSLEGLAESIRENSEGGRLQLADIDGREVDYQDVINALSDGPPEPRATRGGADAEELRRQGIDEATLSGRAAGYKDDFLGPDGQPLFQDGAQRDMFGGEEPAPRSKKPKAEQVDMFGNQGRVAGQGPKGAPDKGLDNTPLQRRADADEVGRSQETLLQEGGARSVTDEALAHYGTTVFHKQGGYLTADGKMLNFGNGGREISDQRRTRGHEDVGRFFRGTPAAKARDLFIGEGNVRLFPEANAIELHTRPTPSQRKALEAWFKKAEEDNDRAGGGAQLHIDAKNGDKMFSRSYPPKTPPARIFADVDAHFAGEVPKPLSDVQRTRAALGQERGKVTKGQIEFLDDGSSTITIFTKHADFSTLMHEYGHWLRRNSLSAVESKKIQRWLKSQKVQVLDEAGNWTREAEERFARAFERYLRDRTAPTPELKSIFEKLRQFMRLVYKQAKESALGKELPPEITQVFDDLLGFKKKAEGPLLQEGLTPREKRADLQKKQAAFPESMPLSGERGQAPAKGRPKEADPGLKGGVQEFTDKRLANPTGRTMPRGEDPTGRTTGEGAQQPLSPGLQGPGMTKGPPPKVTPPPRGDVGGLEARWDVPDETRFDYFLRRVQDKMRPLKLMQRAILKGGRRVLETTDAYLSEELYHGKAGAALRAADKETVTPILKAMREADIDLKQVDEFLYARHATERNEQIARINPDPDRGSGMTDAEAKAILDKARADGTYAKMEAIGEQVDALNEKRLEILEASGLISEETRVKWETTYKHYVPLKGFAEAADTPQAVMDFHLGKGFDVRGPESKRALGRKSLADSPLATAIAQLNESIVRAHKNQVSKTFLKLVLDNPNKDIWEVNKTEFQQSLENGVVVQKQVVNKNDPNVVTAKVLGKEYYVIVKPKYTALAQAMKGLGEEKTGFIVQTLGKVNRVLALINTTLSPEFVLGNFLRDTQTAGINMAGEMGTKFAAKIAKDTFPAMRGVLQGIRESKYLAQSKGVEEWARWYKRFEKAGGKTEYLGLRSIDDIKSDFESKLSKPSTWGKSKEGIKWLGTQIEDINTAVENSIRLAAFKNAVEAGLSEAKAASLAKNLTVNFNRKGELGTLANSMYLFFNANVQGTARIMASMSKAITDPNSAAGRGGKRLWGIAGGLAGAAWGLAEWNRAIAGEDEDGINRYDKIAPFVKERNLIIMLPGSKDNDVQALTIPIPYGYNVFNVVGESISSWMHGGSTLDGALGIGQAMAGAFNPLGSEASQSPAKWITKMATPTVADPVVQYAINEAFTGAPIKPENLPYGTQKPESQLAFKSVSPMARAAAEKLNDITGGSEYRSGAVDVSPEAIEHFVTSYTGSLGKFIYNTIGYVGGTATGQVPDISKTPFARRFFMGESEYFDQKTFADNAREYKPFLEEAKHLSGEESNKFETEFGPQIELAQMAQSIQKQVEKLNKSAKGIRGDKSLSAASRDSELKTIEGEKKKLFREFNREVQARKKKPPAVPALP